jgi:hypothetical protein
MSFNGVQPPRIIAGTQSNDDLITIGAMTGADDGG